MYMFFNSSIRASGGHKVFCVFIFVSFINISFKQVFEFNMEMTCEGCANAAKKVLGKHRKSVTFFAGHLVKQFVVTHAIVQGEQNHVKVIITRMFSWC